LATGGHCGDVEAMDHETVAAFLASPVARTRPDGGVKKATSVNALRSSIKVFFKYCHEAGIVARNPGRLIRRGICSPPPPRALTPDEERKLLAAFATAETPEEKRDVVLFGVMLQAGLRIGSALDLDVTDLDLEHGEVRLRSCKGDQQALVYLNQATRAILREYLGERTEGPVFLAQHSGRPSRRHITRRFKMWLMRAGITRPLTPHSARHTFACRLYERSGGDILLVSRALTHRSLSSTAIYARVPDARLRQALEA